MPLKCWGGVSLPGDPSSAAFLVAAALLLKGSKIQLDNLLLNPYRKGYLDWLEDQGAGILQHEIAGDAACGPYYCSMESCDQGDLCPIGEPVGNVLVFHGPELGGGSIEERQVPGLIDEIPALAAVAMGGVGTFRVNGAAELRLKESDRIAGTCRMLRAFGGTVREFDDGFELEAPAGIRAGRFDAEGDHRLAMAAWVLALAADGPSELEGHESVQVSFPEFPRVLRQLLTRE